MAVEVFEPVTYRSAWFLYPHQFIISYNLEGNIISMVYVADFDQISIDKPDLSYGFTYNDSVLFTSVTRPTLATDSLPFLIKYRYNRRLTPDKVFNFSLHKFFRDMGMGYSFQNKVFTDSFMAFRSVPVMVDLYSEQQYTLPFDIKAYDLNAVINTRNTGEILYFLYGLTYDQDNFYLIVFQEGEMFYYIISRKGFERVQRIPLPLNAKEFLSYGAFIEPGKFAILRAKPQQIEIYEVDVK